jgi:hypothetical protein
MTTTLTERYIAATVKSLAPASVNDVRAELEASIADAIEARVGAGEGRAAAEHAVLTELGDPGILAASYADRPLHLIGPRYYLTWWRLLKVLLAIVPAVAVVGIIIAESLANASIGDVIGSAIGVGISATVHVAFWVTAVFAILERTGADTGLRWEVDQLPEPQESGAGRGTMFATVAVLAVAAAALLWDQFRGLLSLDGEPLAVLNPGLWPWSIAALLVLFVAEAVLAIVIYLAGRWTTGLAIVNTALAVLFVSLTVTLLARGELVNPEFVSAVFTDNGVDAEATRILAMIIGFMMVGTAAWEIVDGWVKAARASRR